MKLIFCVNQDLYANIALNHILPYLSGEDECKVLFSKAVGSKKTKGAGLSYLRFYEQDLLNEWWFPFVEQATSASEASLGQLQTFKQLSQTFNMPMQAITNFRDPELFAEIAAFQPDLIISIRFGHIFKGPILQIPQYGIINLHSGLLPEYRGILATFWSLLHGKTEYGYTIHTIADGTIDTGEILSRQKFPIQTDKCLFEHILSLYKPGAEQIIELLKHYRAETKPPGHPQSVEEGNYYSLPTAEAIERLIQQGFLLVNPAAYFKVLAQYHPQQMPFYSTSLEALERLVSTPDNSV